MSLEVNNDACVCEVTLTAKDATTGGGGFNTFGFLAFLLAGFNAISVVSNNNNNRNNNNNNQNNDNNNNNFQTLESSVTGMQMVGRRRRGAADPAHINLTSADVIMDEDTSSSPGTLYTVMDRFMRAWVKNRMTSDRGCHLLHICEANVPPPASAQSTEVVMFAEVATRGLAREVARQEASTVEDAETEGFLAAGELGAVLLQDYHHHIISVCIDDLFAGRHRGICAERYQCASLETYAMNHLESILYFPSVIHQYIAEK